MNEFIESKLLTVGYETGQDGLETVSVIDRRELFKLSITEIVEKYDNYFNQIPYFRNVNVVYYPGSGAAVLEMMLYTNCSTLICTDLVDPEFYRPLDSTIYFNDKVAVTVEFSETIKDIVYFHNVYNRYFPEKVEEKIRSIQIKDNKCIITFMYNQKLRTIITYLNVDANKFIPKELKSVDLLVESSFVLSDKMRNKINPKMVLIDDGSITQDLDKKYKFKRNIDLEYPYIFEDLTVNNIDYDNKLFIVHKALLFDKIVDRSYVLCSKEKEYKSQSNFETPSILETPSIIKKFETKYTEEQLDDIPNESFITAYKDFLSDNEI